MNAAKQNKKLSEESLTTTRFGGLIFFLREDLKILIVKIPKSWYLYLGCAGAQLHYKKKEKQNVKLL